MRQAVSLVLLVALLAAPVAPAAASATPLDGRDKLIAHLEKTWKTLEEETKDFTPDQWNFKSAPDRWSVADVYEHLAVSEDMLFGLITDRVLKTPAMSEKMDAAKQEANDALVLKMIPDRANRVQAPEPLRPTNRFGSVADTRKQFAERRQRTIDFVKNSTEDLRAHFFDSPVIPGMDAYQWFLFISAHTMRHTAQIREVKADASFPGGAAKPATKQYFLLMLHPTWKTTEEQAKYAAVLQQHVERMGQLFAQNILVIGGPSAAGYGVGVLEVASREEAERLVADDPAVRAGAFRVELVPFSPAFVRKP
jgi:uncharacterized protein YciI